MSAELLILSITGALALLTYIVKHCRGSECWSKEKCCSIKMDIASEPPTPQAPPPSPISLVQPNITTSSVI